MLKSYKSSRGTELSFASAKVGDRFCWLTKRKFTFQPIASEEYMVLRVEAHDVVVTPVNGGGEKRIDRTLPLPNAYLPEGSTH
ncbi:hypothetical protein HAQ01_06860 [Acidithiobacillus thiooxidans]|uniref:hypothetical protein n=1 Tax=Acidithiobacillus thiooxidans TaxID=930 RepID=UPI001C0764A5|nr:hypothetical protein [Acidithiobacillus thiooxidans]MBU2793109.1 hypothetical protein [Acidithiobacillus thiooxidans]